MSLIKRFLGISVLVVSIHYIKSVVLPFSKAELTPSTTTEQKHSDENITPLIIGHAGYHQYVPNCCYKH